MVNNGDTSRGNRPVSGRPVWKATRSLPFCSTKFMNKKKVKNVCNGTYKVLLRMQPLE